jgi:AcrR family transcriptional regulator
MANIEIKNNKRYAVSRYFQELSVGENKKIRTRGVLFDSALTMFHQGGIRNTRLEDVTRHAGMANATFYNHFKDKDELVQALALAIAAELLGPLEERLAVDLLEIPTRVVVANTLMMHAVLEQEPWGKFLVQSFYVDPSSYAPMLVRTKDMFRLGVERGFFTCILDDFLMDQVHSQVLSSLRTLDPLNREGLIDRTSENILRLLGMTAASARSAVGKGRALISKNDCLAGFSV